MWMVRFSQFGGRAESVCFRHRSVKLVLEWLIPGILYNFSRGNCSYAAVPATATLMKESKIAGEEIGISSSWRDNQ